ncbi:hypothetical protein [Pleomorphomonas koreensis]|uniref:hypothetical protein n=1 Tax=Pleomorphomonas koreensis TaxID=257440 RepID=UPI0004090498|nr:hypothetical protein [Pleomorphomonas koreensis]
MAEAPTKYKPSIDDQIAAYCQLADAEANRIEFRVSRGQLRPETAQRQLDVQSATRTTLAFVRKYADGFRAYIEAQRTFEREREAKIAAAQASDDAGRDAA